MVVLLFNFSGSTILFSIGLAPRYIPSNRARRSSFSTCYFLFCFVFVFLIVAIPSVIFGRGMIRAMHWRISLAAEKRQEMVMALVMVRKGGTSDQGWWQRKQGPLKERSSQTYGRKGEAREMEKGEVTQVQSTKD